MTSGSYTSNKPRTGWTALDELAERLETARITGGPATAMAYQELLIKHGPELVEIARSARSVHLGYTCPQDPMDVDERLERLGTALVPLAKAMP